MIRYYVRDNGSVQEIQQLDQASWINLYPPFKEGELEGFAGILGLEPDFFTDPLDLEERARYERFDEARSIILHTPVVNESVKENDAIYITIPLGIILCQNKIITVSPIENPVIEKFQEYKVKNFDPSNERQFILQIMEQNVLYFLELLKKLNIRRSLIEQELYNSSRSEELKSLLRIEKSLVYFVNSLNGNELLKIKMRRTDFLGIKDNEDQTEWYEDIIIDNNQAREVAQLYTNILNGTMEAYAAIISNNLNKFINRLTVVTVILMVPTLVASFFGMNVKLPFALHESNISFFLILVISIGISLGLAWFFKRKEIW
ncbi:MAG: magnesium transporter CorA family protein [Saprospiraceae bacterium]|nr:magnesium transporter CorA family protein [Saprospiraceae bacterium]